jgi:hydroxypyruvate reductase
VPEVSNPNRAWLLGLFAAGLAAVDGRRRMRLALAGRREPGDVWLLAVGKAAAAMTLGAMDALGPRITRALVVSRRGYLPAELCGRQQVTCLTGGHPLPDAGSLAAGTAALAMAREAPADQRVLLLVSGGASSLVEQLREGVTLADLRRINEWALASGLPIEPVNALRRRLSMLKDGGLAARFGHCRAEGFFISDVPGDDAAVVGSGLLAACTGRVTGPEPPDWVASVLARAGSPGPAGRAVPSTCVGCLDDSLAAIREAALAAGVAASVCRERLAGDATAAAAQVCKELAAVPRGLLICGGETTVRLPAAHGEGGRNQHLALAAARLIDGCDDRLLLAAGTDGSDGTTDDAGALVDGGTIERGRDAGLDADQCLAAADSARFLAASGDLVHTGPTGTNVGDLLLALRGEPVHGPGRGQAGRIAE